MASRPPFRYDPLRLLQTLARHRVEHVIVGGVAARLRGSPLVTEDLDIVPQPAGDNYDRLAAALTELNPYQITPVFRKPIPRAATADALRDPDFSSWFTMLGRVDVMNRVGGDLDHAALLHAATPFDLGDGVVVLAAGLDDVIASKEAANRPKDLGALPILYELREELRRRASP